MPDPDPLTTDPIIAGLLRERDGYLRTGRSDRAALVADQLRLRGHPVDDAGASEPARRPPQGRTTRPRQTTAGTTEAGKE